MQEGQGRDLSLYKPGIEGVFACNDGFVFDPPNATAPTCTCMENINGTAAWSCSLQTPATCKPSELLVVRIYYKAVLPLFTMNTLRQSLVHSAVQIANLLRFFEDRRFFVCLSNNHPMLVDNICSFLYLKQIGLVTVAEKTSRKEISWYSSRYLPKNFLHIDFLMPD